MSLFESAKQPVKKALDLSGLQRSVPAVPPDKEARAVAKGEELGFKSREAIQVPMPTEPVNAGQGRTPRKKQRSAKVFIVGPEAVINRFVEYTNDSGVAAYWQALDKLLSEVGK